jgi:hypothetical protein
VVALRAGARDSGRARPKSSCARSSPPGRPRDRVGTDAKLGFALTRLLPDRLLDRALERLTRA